MAHLLAELKREQPVCLPRHGQAVPLGRRRARTLSGLAKHPPSGSSCLAAATRTSECAITYNYLDGYVTPSTIRETIQSNCEQDGVAYYEFRHTRCSFARSGGEPPSCIQANGTQDDQNNRRYVPSLKPENRRRRTWKVRLLHQKKYLIRHKIGTPVLSAQ